MTEAEFATIKKFKLRVVGTAGAMSIAAMLTHASQWFSITPMPDDIFEVCVKLENGKLLTNLADRLSVPTEGDRRLLVTLNAPVEVSVHDGLIWRGKRHVSAAEGDHIAQANGLVYAEEFVKAHDGKTVKLDPRTLAVIEEA